ncbi:MAG: EMC3/TMCO1 family protein [Nitrosopumilus sp.]|nr:EMC3/TMCO1 family protein [Nitrosopumilus sp.]
MIESLDHNFILLFLDGIFLQGDDGGIFSFLSQNRQALGSDDPMIKGLILSMFAVSGFGVVLNVFNSLVRKKMVDQDKLKRIMKETKGWQKERMTAMRSKDQAKIAELSKKSSYMNKMSMEMMQMNMRPMMITFVPLILIFYLVLPQLFAYTVAISPISLNVIPGDFFQLTCTAEQALDVKHVCFGKENALYLWAWYFLSSISFSGIIMKLTKTSMNLS